MFILVYNNVNSSISVLVLFEPIKNKLNPCFAEINVEENTTVPVEDCKSTRILYNSGTDNWYCLDCFSNFSIK